MPEITRTRDAPDIDFSVLQHGGFVRIALWHNVFANSCLTPELNREFVQRAINDGLANINKVRFQKGQNVHYLWVAEARIIFNNPQPISRPHKATIKNAFVLLACFREQSFANKAIYLGCYCNVICSKEGQQMVRTRIGTHAAGVWALVSVASALVVLDWNCMGYVATIKKGLVRKLFAIESLFNDDGCMPGLKQLIAISHRLWNRCKM